MAKNTVWQLNAMREEVLRQQSTILAQIVADANHPDLTSSLVLRIMDSQVRYNDLTKQFGEAVAKQNRDPWWQRMWRA